MTLFKFEGREYIELNDLLKVTGLFDSGGMAKTAISEGRVTVRWNCTDDARFARGT